MSEEDDLIIELAYSKPKDLENRFDTNFKEINDDNCFAPAQNGDGLLEDLQLPNCYHASKRERGSNVTLFTVSSGGSTFSSPVSPK